MGSGASSPLVGVEKCYEEITAECNRGNIDSAIFLASHACEHLQTIEEHLHRCLPDRDRIKSLIPKVVYIGSVAGIASKEYVDCLNMASIILLLFEDDLVLAEQHINEAFNICSGFDGTGGGRSGPSYVVVLATYFWLRTLQNIPGDALWAKKKFDEVVQAINLVHADMRFSTRAIFYRFQNIAIVHEDSKREFDMMNYVLKEFFGESVGNEDISVEVPSPVLEKKPSEKSISDSISNYGSIISTHTELHDILFCLVETVHPNDDALNLSVKQNIKDAFDSCSASEIVELVTKKNEKGDTMLLAACRARNHYSVATLLEIGRTFKESLDLTPQLLGARNAVGLTPLHLCCQKDFISFEIADILLRYGGAAACYNTDRNGCSPLHYAAETGSPTLVSLLLLQGASVKQQDRAGYIPVDYCDPTNIECIDLLFVKRESDSGIEWERLTDDDSKRVYFKNRISGETCFESLKPACKRSDEDLLKLFANFAWTLGVAKESEKRRQYSMDFAISQAKARLHLIEAGEAQHRSLKRIVDFKNQTLNQLRQDLRDQINGRNASQEQMKMILEEIQEERQLRLEEHEAHIRTQDNLILSESELSKTQKILSQLQIERDRVLKSLSDTEDEITAMELQAKEASGLSEQQKTRLEELRQTKSSLESQLQDSMKQIDTLVQQLEKALKSNQLSSSKMKNLSKKLEEEKVMRLQALSELSRSQENAKHAQIMINQVNTEKDKIERQLEEEQKLHEDENRLRVLKEQQLLDAESEMSVLGKALSSEVIEKQLAVEELHRIQTEIKSLAGERLKDAKYLAQKEQEARARIIASEKVVENLSRELHEAQDAKSRVTNELADLKQKLEEERLERERTAKYLDRMKQKLSCVNGEMSMLTKHLENEQSERAKNKEELLKVQREISMMQQQHAERLAKSHELSAEAKEHAKMLQIRQSKLNSQLEQSALDIDRLNGEVEGARLNQSQAVVELEALNARLLEERAMRISMNEELGNTKDKLQSIQDDILKQTTEWERERMRKQAEKEMLQSQGRRLLGQLQAERESRVGRDRESELLKKKLADRETQLQQAQRLSEEEKNAKKQLMSDQELEMQRLRDQIEHERKLRMEKDAELKSLKQKEQHKVDAEKQTLVQLLNNEQLRAREAIGELKRSKDELEEERQRNREHLQTTINTMQDKIYKESRSKEAYVQELFRIREEQAKMAAMTSKSDEDAERKAELDRRSEELMSKTKEMEQLLQNLEVEKDEIYDEFIQEQALRKQYFNEIEDLKGRIRVFCRVRPDGESTSVSVIDNMNLMVTNDTGANNRKRPDFKFVFDRCFDPEATQEEVFADAKRLIQTAVDGYNICVFAYGQPGSGKTYTLMGSNQDEGIATRSIRELFSLMGKEGRRFEFETTMYIVELYKDELFDLLLRDKSASLPLNVHLDPQGVVDIENVTKKVCVTTEEALGNLRHAFSLKKAARAHLLCSILIKSTSKSSGVVTHGKLTIADLAGTERASKTGAKGDALKEAQSINKSLLALGDVIQALTSGSKHVPYRNHPLTELMADSLGGNAKTLMFVNVSPSQCNTQESKESLRWATRVKQVTNQSNKVQESSQIKALRDQLQKLQQDNTPKEIETLKLPRLKKK